MFLEYFGYKLRVSQKGFASYVTPEITIYRDLTNFVTRIYTPNWCATVYSGDRETIEKILSGEVFDRVIENNPFVSGTPRSFAWEPWEGKFVTVNSDPCPMKFVLDQDRGLRVITDVFGKRMGASKVMMFLDEDYRLLVKPTRKYTFIPCMNGRALSEEAVYVEDTIDKYHDEINAKTTRPFVSTRYLREIEPDYVFMDFSASERIIIKKGSLIAEYEEFFRPYNLRIYCCGRVVREISGDKRSVFTELIPLMHAGRLIGLL